MFRKSGHVREHEQQRRFKEDEPVAASIAKFQKEDIESYDNREAKEYFLSKEDAIQKEKMINETIQSLRSVEFKCFTTDQ